MIQVTCKYISVADVPNINFIEPFIDAIKPIEYTFDDFKVGEKYTLLGINTLSQIFRFYTVVGTEIISAPAILFECDWSTIPHDWCLRAGQPGSESFEIIPKRLAELDNWFERYIDDDPEVLELVAAEIKGGEECS